MSSRITRRHFLAIGGSITVTGATVAQTGSFKAEPIIDIHQHQGYKGRTREQFRTHQRMMGVTTTVILPSARAFDRRNDGSRLNPDRAKNGNNGNARELAGKHPKEFVRFANELPTIPLGIKTIEQNLQSGAIGIGESKFEIDCDSPHIERLAELAQTFKVPILLHFQHGKYNQKIHQFHRILKKYPKVNFIGHAQTWWGNIDRNHQQAVMYPKGKVTPGGITDRLLSEYPNVYGDLSAGSGNNSLSRDEEHTRGFLERHQDKLMFGSDCNDTFGSGPRCVGARTIGLIRKLSSSKIIERKILYENARQLLKLNPTS